MFHITYFCAHMKQKLTFWKMLCLEKKTTTIKYGGMSAMLCSCFAVSLPGHLVITDRIMNLNETKTFSRKKTLA